MQPARLPEKMMSAPLVELTTTGFGVSSSRYDPESVTSADTSTGPYRT
ncbi:hypothetical protein [Streptomyces sp. AS02]|nr:hypothetical protein [Streptomyces sp. AS02]MCL8011895.1 hypothetical protein [Streptomyces sp. AS02]